MKRYTVVKDTEYDEYALLYKDKLKEVFNRTHKVLAEGQKDMDISGST